MQKQTVRLSPLMSLSCLYPIFYTSQNVKTEGQGLQNLVESVRF